MPDERRHSLLYEGDDDKAVLEGLEAAGLIPPRIEIMKRSPTKPGESGLVLQLATLVSPVNGIDARTIALIDFDDRTSDALAKWFASTLKAAVNSSEVTIERVGVGHLAKWTLSANGRVGHVVLVPVGVNSSQDQVNIDFGIQRFAMDDWVLRLLLDERVYSAVGEFKSVSYAIMRKKYDEVAAVFRDNGLPVVTAKRYVQILRAVVGARPSTATILGKVIKTAGAVLGPDGLHAMLAPLIEDIATASRYLDGTSG